MSEQNEQTTESAEQARMAEMREAFDRTRTKDAEPTEKPSLAGILEETTGTEAAPEEAAPEQENTTEAEEASEETIESEEEAKPERRSKEHEKALRNLKLAGLFEDDYLESLSSEAAIAKWDRLAEAELNQKQRIRELAELRKELDALKATEDSEPELRAAPTESEDLSEAVQAFKSEFGEEAAGAFEKIASAVSRLERENHELRGSVAEQANQMLIAQRTEAVVDGARSRLSGDYPQLADPEALGGVLETMQQLSSLPKYQGIETVEGRADALMRDACRLMELEETKREPVEPKAKKPAPKQPVTASQKDSKPLDPEKAALREQRAVFNRVRQKTG